MFGSEVLEVAIGVTFVFLVTSLLCTAIREGIEAWLKTRAVDLERGIRELLHDETGTGLAKELYSHPQVYGLYRGDYDPGEIGKDGRMPTRSDLPSYIPSRQFALALLDIAARGPSTATPPAAGSPEPRLSLSQVRATIGNIRNPPVQRALLAAIDAANEDLGRAQANVEAWYDGTMDRVAGWYKRRTQKILLALGFVVALVANINAIAITRALYEDGTMRQGVIAAIQAGAAESARAAVGADSARAPAAQAGSARPAPARAGSVENNLARLEGLRLPIGWDDGWGGPRAVRGPSDGQQASVWYYVSPVLGWIITALAVTLGAPFWFDVLNKIMVIRSTVKPHEKSPEEASEDRQRGARPSWSGDGALVVGMDGTLRPAVATTGAAERNEWATGPTDEGAL